MCSLRNKCIWRKITYFALVSQMGIAGCLFVCLHCCTLYKHMLCRLCELNENLVSCIHASTLICLGFCLTVCLSANLFCSFVCLSVRPWVCLSLSGDTVKCVLQ